MWGTAPVDQRSVFTAIVYVLTSGCSWRNLPEEFGVSGPTAHRRFGRNSPRKTRSKPRKTRSKVKQRCDNKLVEPLPLPKVGVAALHERYIKEGEGINSERRTDLGGERDPAGSPCVRATRHPGPKDPPSGYTETVVKPSQ